MKMQLMSLTLDNFKGYEHKEFRFEGRSATLFGRNGTGKTTVYDAFTWLLFGKDSKGDKDFQIKPVFQEGERAGEVKDHAAVTSVEAVLLVDGAQKTLRRTYYEVWSVKRGTGEATFDGHSSDYYVDGVPVKKNEFERRVGELLPEGRFKLLTSLFYFTKQLPWRERRAVLFDVVGVVTDGEILASDGKFEPLVEAMGGLSLDDLRKKLTARRKGLNKTREDTPARLDECRKTVEALGGIDFAALEREREGAANARGALRAEIEASYQDSEAERLDGALLEARGALQKLEAENAAYRESQKRPDEAAARLAAEAAGIRNRIDLLTAKGKRRRGELTYLMERLDDLEREIARCRQQWNEIDAEVFSGELCPTCGQRLPREKLVAAINRFEQSKARRKAQTVEAANRGKQRRQEALEDVERLEEEEAGDAKKLEELRGRLEVLTQAQDQDKAPEITDLPNYEADRAGLERQITDLSVRHGDRLNAAAVRRKVLQEDLRRCEAELDRLAGELAKRAHLEIAHRRMDELREQAAKAAGELARVDGMLQLCDQFTRYKVRFIEESVNRRFELVKFRLFREQINGGIEDCCDVLVGGAAVGNSLNTGAEFQAGVDIINTLSRCYDTYVPLFIDGAESVTEPLRAGTQVIRLAVAENDKELRCELQ